MPSVALTLLRSKQGLRFAAASLLCVSLFAQHGHGHDAAAEKKPEAPARTLGDYALVAAAGKPLPLSAYKGKIVLIVNIASHSQYSGQVAALSRLQDEDRDKGLVVIGVPSNDFGKSEPGTDAEIQKHYKDELHATFLVTAKSTLTGVHELPAFVFLTGGAPDGKPGEPVHWNFTKFIVGRDGQVLARYAPDVAPDDPEFRIAIEKALDGRLKPKEGDKGGAKPAAGDDDDDDGPDV